MAQALESFDFDTYELIPREDNLKPPIHDQASSINSKPYVPKSFPEEHKTQQESQHESQNSKQNDENLRNLETKLSIMISKLEQEEFKNRNISKIMLEIKQIIGKPSIPDVNLPQQIQSLYELKKIQVQINHEANDKQFDFILKQKEQQIHNLKQQLLQSTQNNINAIFQSEVKSEQCIFKEISTLRDQLKKINSLENKNECKHEQKLMSLIRSYEQMLNLYHKSQNSMHEIKNRQEESFSYFSSLHSQLKHALQKQSSQQTVNKLNQLENILKSMAQSLNNAPEKVKTDQDQEIKLKQFLVEMENLNQRLIQRQIQIEKLREKNQQLMAKTREFDQMKEELRKMREVEQKVRVKDKRILVLENIIIEHIDSRAKDDSITSQDSDVQKQRNNVRNLKVLVSNLKQQNRTIKVKIKQLQTCNVDLRKKISNITVETSSKIEEVQRVNKDQSSIKIVQQIVEVLVVESQSDSQCKCLQKTTDCLLGLNEEYPELEVILEELGVIQKTSNLIPVGL